MRADQCHVGKFRRIHSRCVIWATDTRCVVRHAGHSRPIQPATHTEMMIEHDRNPASRQADHPVDEDDPPLAALQQGAGRDLTCQPDRSARHHDVRPVYRRGAVNVRPTPLRPLLDWLRLPDT